MKSYKAHLEYTLTTYHLIIKDEGLSEIMRTFIHNQIEHLEEKLKHMASVANFATVQNN